MRTWKVRMTSYWPLLVALCLTGLGLGDSPLVILSLCSLTLSCVLSFFSSSSFYLFTLSFSFIFFSLSYVFLHKVVYLNIYLYYLSKKKDYVLCDVTTMNVCHLLLGWKEQHIQLIQERRSLHTAAKEGES